MSKENTSSSYRSILKGTSFFGGVQVFNILITLIRGKFVAVILGPEGMGISALFNSASNTIQRFASLGLNQAIVKDVASADEKERKGDTVITTSLRLTHLTALLGFIICGAFCIPLSRVTFGDISYWWQFIILGAGVFFMISSTGKLSILQGLHEVKRISKASVVGGLTGLFIGVPLYYLFGDKGIVPAILAVSLSLYIFYSVSLRRSYKERSEGSWKECWPIAKAMIALGLVLMVNDILVSLIGYLINLYIRYHGSVDIVGLYQAANTVTGQFTGFVFAAIAMDYFPRLSKVASDNYKMGVVVNRQSEIVSWLMTPAVAILILSTPLLIRILLAESFHSIVPLMKWLGLGVLIRGFSFPMAYITFAKGNKKVFFLMEGLLANAMTLVLSCLFFHWYGLLGLGYALVADNLFCFIIYFIVNNKLYHYLFTKSVVINYLLGLGITGSVFVVSFLRSAALSYSLMGTITAGAFVWSFLSIKKCLKQPNEEENAESVLIEDPEETV